MSFSHGWIYAVRRHSDAAFFADMRDSAVSVTAVTIDQNRPRELVAFMARAVDRARQLAGPLLERADLEQAAELAVLEVEAAYPADGDGDGGVRVERVRRCRRRVVIALKSQLRVLGRGPADAMGLERLLDDDVDVPGAEVRLPAQLWAAEEGDEVASKAEAVAQVREVVAAMPIETARVVQLCFGLDGTDAVEPIDVADILDESPESVLGHLWVAEKLFRHFSTDSVHRRLTPMTALEFQAFRLMGDLAWYDLRQLNLNNADLRRCELTHADLSGMNLWGACLAGVNGENVNLWGAQMDGADLVGADLRFANLERVGLRRADLSDAVLIGANLWGADLAGALAKRVNLMDAEMCNANLHGAHLTRAKLGGADLRGADLREARLVGADLTGANLQGAKLTGADLRWADLRNSDLSWSNLWAADLDGATLRGATRAPKLDAGVFGVKAPLPRRRRPVAATA